MGRGILLPAVNDGLACKRGRIQMNVIVKRVRPSRDSPLALLSPAAGAGRGARGRDDRKSVARLTALDAPGIRITVGSDRFPQHRKPVAREEELNRLPA